MDVEKELDLDRNKKIIAGLVGLTALVGLVPFVIAETSVETQTVEFNPRANVTSDPVNSSENVSLGVAPGGNGLNFGELPIRSTKQARKTVELNSDQKALIKISSSGNVSEFLVYNDTVYFEGAEQLEIGFTTLERGYYEGELKMKIMTPRNRIGKKWIELRSYF
ncbi:hypothetical protein [Candidatus Nanohalococcus occultus]|uniref:Uncharacterized protein n=1 Tax=Candidatus Nanohalococcus occultus TaxID=2978047 RepID=A0ABY8CDI0_9ARCH|nr:hypothetical protein SVXNc_0248 [Candidatus Nanohaloarchaeota archaeon SVXNc]